MDRNGTRNGGVLTGCVRSGPAGDPARARFLRLLVWIVANIYPTFTYGDYPERWAPRDAEALVA
ncbi:hypothetical protein LAM40_24290, partial [Mycobacterium tuberculosis]|nr:hypothetical protein [Mycobacterium tuberculosis]